jgi:hypothetical protein
MAEEFPFSQDRSIRVVVLLVPTTVPRDRGRLLLRIYKQSGIGREFSLGGMLDSFTQRKDVTVNLNAPRKH